MLPTARRVAAAATAGLLLSVAAISPAMAGPAAAPAATPLAAGGKAYTGFSNGTLEYINVLNLGPDVAKVGLGQSAAGVQVPGPLSSAVIRDQLKQPVLIASPAGKTAYGHGSGANVGLVDDITAEPNVIQDALSEATSPAPSSSGPNTAVNVPVSPVITAQLLKTSAAANTLADNSCVFGKDLGRGQAEVTNAELVAPNTTTAVADVDATSESISHVRLAQFGANTGLESATRQFLEPLTLFKGTPGVITVEVLGNKTIELKATASGAPGGSVITYGQPGASGTTPVVRVTVGGVEVANLTSQQVFGASGVVLALGAADITIGGPAHSLTGLEGTPPTKAANGTHASAAVDFIRVSIPGRLPPGPGTPELFDLRIGHMEASATVPVGGIDCALDEGNPLDESRKDVTATHVTAGQTFNYTIRVPNRGTSPITNVTVEDTYSAALEFVSSVPPPASHTGNVLRFNLGTLEPNEFATIVMTFRVPANATPGTVYRNSAIIRGTYNGQPISFPVAVNGPIVTGPLPGNCNMGGSKKYASNTHVKTGEVFGYFINVFNSGGTACRNVVVKDTLISGVSFVSCNRGCIRSGQNLTWNLGTVASGQSIVLSVLVKVTARSGRLPNAAVITASNGKGANPRTPGPLVGNVSRPAPGDPAVLVRDGQLPRTGASAAAAALGGLLLLGGAVAMRRRRPGAIG